MLCRASHHFRCHKVEKVQARTPDHSAVTTVLTLTGVKDLTGLHSQLPTMRGLSLFALVVSSLNTTALLDGKTLINGSRQDALAHISGKLALCSECSLFIFFSISFMCLFIFLNKFIISFLFSVYIPSMFLPKPCRVPHSANLLAFKIHLH